MKITAGEDVERDKRRIRTLTENLPDGFGLAIDANTFVGSTLLIPNIALFFSFAYVVALLPFFLLTSYVIRAAIIAEETVTAGAFTVE